MRVRARVMRVVADDLSGAAEAAGVLYRHGLRATVSLDTRSDSGSATVFDLHVRNAGPGAAAKINTELSALGTVDYIKIDSQMRGPLAELVDAAAQHSPVVLAPALPQLNRSVSGGVLLLDGVSLRHSEHSAWRTEAGPPPDTLAAVCGSHTPYPFTLEDVRSGAFAQRVAAGRIGDVFIPDSTTEEDLRIIAEAIRTAPALVMPIGSAGLLQALVADHSSSAKTEETTPDASEKAVLVLGSLEPILTQQHAALEYHATTVFARPDVATATLSALIREALTRSPRTIVVKTQAKHGVHDVNVAQRVGHATADAVRHDPTIGLGLIGGETARAVLHALGERSLSIRGEVHPGAALSVTAYGRRVVTRPGSFGGIDSLTQITTTLLGDAPGDRQEEGIQ
ncbi:uncharacterized protein YgbK (DUF1537 family) [Microbacterium sp. SORGH_AS 1204]|nr:uncharacterized protein YgbK (DUF1537 family) [Microbacterium sp. SORGH_AS_1204]